MAYTEVGKRAQDQLERIKKNVKNSYEAFQHNYERFNDFRKFIFETSLSSDDISLLNSLGKPQIEFNVTEAYISRLMGEFSKQEPSISISARDENRAAPETVSVVEKHLRHIMFDTKNSPTQYEVMKDLYSGGFSCFKIWTDYANDKSFDQEIHVDRVYDPTLVGFDQLARDAHKGDGQFCFELFPMHKDDFKRDFPDANIDDVNFLGTFSGFNWAYLNGNTPIILVCDYYEKKKRKVKIVQLVDGSVKTEKEYKAMLESYNGFEQPPAIKGSPRWSQMETVCRYRCIENQVIEYSETDFTFFPLIFADGNSIMLKNPKNGGNAYQMTRPYVYHAKGAQKLKNFAGISLANEIENMVQHKIIIAKEALPKEEDWLAAYKDVQKPSTFVFNAFYDEDPDKPIANPIREVQRVGAPPEIMQAFSGTDSLIQNILGSYDSALGINDNQLSGIAVVESASQSNAAAMPYLVGYLQAWQRVAELIVDLIPKYYKTPRTIPILGIDGKREYVKINQEQGVEIEYEPNALDVRVEAGVSYAIQKNRALQQIIALQQSSPLFAQFMNEKGLPVLLDNIEIRGIDQLKEMVEEWQQEMQQQKQMAMQQQQQEMQNNPAVIKNQLQAQKLQMDMQKNQSTFALDMQKMKLDQQKLLTDALIAHNNNQVQLIKAQTERFAKQVDQRLAHHDMRHRHHKEVYELKHMNKEAAEA